MHRYSVGYGTCKEARDWSGFGEIRNNMLIPMERKRMPISGIWFVLRVNDLVYFTCFRKVICRVWSWAFSVISPGSL